MNLSSSQLKSGIIGCADPEGGCRRTLAEWAQGRGAETLCADEAFVIWGWSAAQHRLHPLQSPALCGLLAGDLYTDPCTNGRSRNPAPAAVVTAGYGRGGPAFLLHLAGQFNTFLWDRRHRELILFRDDSGARSLYYKQLPSGAVLFSDQLDLLVSCPLADKRLARRSIHEFLRFLDVSAPNTIYERVFTTEPGVLTRIANGHIHQEQTPQPAPAAPLKSLTTAALELEHRLTDAISARVKADGTTAIFLSGGVDSSLICALAVARRETRIEAVTVGFTEQEFDESSIARKVAKHLGVAHHVLSFPMRTYRQAFDKLTAGICYPSADPAGIPTLLAFQSAREYTSSALDGTGADTLFGVMPARHQRIAVQFGTMLSRPLRRIVARALKGLPELGRYAPLVDFDDPEEVLIRWRGWQRSELERLCGEPVSLTHTQFYRLFRQFPRDAHLQRYSALLGNLPDDRIHQAAALTGLEVRFPYSDARVTEWVAGLDLNLRYHPAEPKRLLKTVLDQHVPRALWEQPKHGFDFPFLRLMTSDDCALVRQYLDPQITERWKLFEPEMIQSIKNTFLRGDWRSAFAAESPAFKVWALVVLFAWLENHYRHL